MHLRKGWFGSIFGSAPTDDVRAMVVGINRYAMPGIDLQYCVADARAVYQRLMDLGVSPLRMRLLLDSEATHEAYLDALKWCLDVKPGGWSFLYHSGHGTTVPEGVTGWDEYKPGQPGHGVDEALVLHDSSHGRVLTDDIYAGVIRDPVAGGVRHVGAFDTCFSGGMARLFGVIRGRYVNLGGMPFPVTRRFGYRSGAENLHLTIAACQEAEVSIEAVMPNGKGHGAFTFHWLRNFTPDASWNVSFRATLADMKMAGISQTPALIGGADIRNRRPFER